MPESDDFNKPPAGTECEAKNCTQPATEYIVLPYADCNYEMLALCSLHAGTFKKK